MKLVDFTILEFIDPRKNGCTLVTNRIYSGNYIQSNDRVEILDDDTDWVFYNNDTCMIIPNPFETKQAAAEFALEKLSGDMQVMVLFSNKNYFLANPDKKVRPLEKNVYTGSVSSLIAFL